MRSFIPCMGCGEDIEMHSREGSLRYPVLVCPDGIHEFEPDRCAECGGPLEGELAEVVLRADPTGGSNVVHEPCFDRERMMLA